MKCPHCYSPWLRESNLIHIFECRSSYAASFNPQWKRSKMCLENEIVRLKDAIKILQQDLGVKIL